jgi:bifunctional ADP-heptose synthase (sugar kinase/adenylyltransferase)
MIGMMLIVISDYNKGFLTTGEEYLSCLDLGLMGPVIIDSKKTNYYLR